MKIIKLRPNADSRAVRFGAPWVFNDQLVMDRRTRAIESGSFVELHDTFGNYTATGTFNSNSKIAFRVLHKTEGLEIDDDWIKEKITSAMAMRSKIYDTPFYRLAHAEGDGLPGLIIDRFGECAVIQPNASWANNHADMIADVLVDLGIENVHLNAQGRVRKIEGLDDVSKTLKGTLPKQVEVEMNGAIYIADLLGGQKTGIFYDQRDNHAFAARLAKGGAVLDVFSHVGGFGLAALAGGATRMMAIDGSQPALDLAAQGAKAMGKADLFEARKGDAFDQMNILIEEGVTFETVICDPPAFAPNKKAVEAGLRAYERVALMAAKLVAPGGYLGLCSCSHAATAEKFAASSIRGIGRAGRVGQILHRGAAGADHPTHPYLIESGYLKSIFFRLN